MEDDTRGGKNTRTGRLYMASALKSRRFSRSATVPFQIPFKANKFEKGGDGGNESAANESGIR